MWRDPATYREVLRRDFLEPLRQLAREHGAVPAAQQHDLLCRLHWYFTADMRERAPTVTLTESEADGFHALLEQIMAHVDDAALASFAAAGAAVEVRHALYSYRRLRAWSPAVADACDHRQRLLRLSYYVHGEPPVEQWLVDGRPCQPVFEKYRGCRFFHRLRFRQRIVWLPLDAGSRLELRLDGVLQALCIDDCGFALVRQDGQPRALNLAEAQACFLPGKGGRRRAAERGLRSLKARVLRTLARLPWIRQRYRDAWVFIDRNENADDNAEHLYRWVRAQRPQVNAWFLLNRDSADWQRLQRDGFRLVPPGLTRKLLLLNSRHIVSSHTDLVFGGFDRALYAPSMDWHFTFLQHGVTKDDMSRWLGPRQFDGVVTSGPAEQEAFAGADSGYPYTAREVWMTGMPRYDRLLRLQRDRTVPARTLLVMPTWRGGAFEERTRGMDEAERKRIFATTEYARAWSALLRSTVLHEALAQHGWRLAFMPHLNSLPYADVFDVPPGVEVISVLRTRIQDQLVAAGAFLTDYTSVAFDMALLRKAVFYYQFDREYFFRGGHNWRPGYFDYVRDGFGPVAESEDECVSQVAAFLASGARVAPVYRQRMERAMPLDDERACQRTYEAIAALDRPRSRAVDATPPAS
ncbi:CDP-glycerol glycerophosphotransferase family protein [Pseudothauera lacus]|nr:CDP-glycerol glycerophosphotransferase family protein [Pseudothauera lacus]